MKNNLNLNDLYELFYDANVEYQNFIYYFKDTEFYLRFNKGIIICNDASCDYLGVVCMSNCKTCWWSSGSANGFYTIEDAVHDLLSRRGFHETKILTTY